MPRKITWKKGMRLGKEVFDSSDQMKYDALYQVAAMAVNGRFGLYQSARPFALDVNISNNLLEVISLSCHGITRGGHIVDIEFDSNYSNTFDTRVMIPEDQEGAAYYLVVRLLDGEWREINDTVSESKYTFELIGENSPIGTDMLPIACVVNQYGWRLNDMDFVPPCLFISAHHKYIAQLSRAKSIVKGIADRCDTSAKVAKMFMMSVWTAASNAYFRLDKEAELLTPNELYAILQQFTNAFMIGCALDPYLSLENPEPFEMYVEKGLNNKRIYQDIEHGLSLWEQISMKVNAVCDMEEPEPAPQPKPAKREQPLPPPMDELNKRRWKGIEV